MSFNLCAFLIISKQLVYMRFVFSDIVYAGLLLFGQFIQFFSFVCLLIGVCLLLFTVSAIIVAAAAAAVAALFPFSITTRVYFSFAFGFYPKFKLSPPIQRTENKQQQQQQEQHQLGFTHL